ncbi:MAG: hypothetical protein K2Q03_02370 [Sphingobacteriaceae bacterium]|nr:hypothetical protein [Sphingobacteriaceae bacterium]
MNLLKTLFLTSLFAIFFLACSDTKSTQSEAKNEQKNNAKPQFEFYKNIEIRPGLNYEIISWGKGIDSLGGYTIYMSDSLKRVFKSATFERKGKITDVWNMDLDTDGNPEFYIQLLSKKNNLDLNVVEFIEGGFRKISFPSLSEKTKKIYQGNDSFFVKEDKLIRTIPIVKEENKVKIKSIDTVQYQLRGKQFSVSGFFKK